MHKVSKHALATVAGWYGTVAVVGAYVLVTFDVISAQSLPYQLLNITGALGLMTIAIVQRANSVVILNLFWVVIAVVSVIISLTR